MKKLLFVLIVIPIILLSADSTVYISRLDVATNPTDGVIGWDYQIWGSYHQDSLGFHEDSIIWDGSTFETLYVHPSIEVGKFNLFALELFGDVDSLGVEYELEATLDDFVRTPWDWNVLIALTPADSMYRVGVLACDPFDKYILWRLIDTVARANRVLFFRFKPKESG